MKYDYRKEEKPLYALSTKPALLLIPSQKFVMIDGKGDPNNDDFSQRVGALYPVAYGIKMQFKARSSNLSGQAEAFPYDDFAVYPLEGIWSAESKDVTNKDNFIYTIMIRQPDFITQDLFDDTLESVKKKKAHPFLEEVRFGTVEDGQCVQMLHIGPFDDEPASFAQMDAFAAAQGYMRASYIHREIYMSDPRRTLPEKRKTILRYQVEKSAQ